MTAAEKAKATYEALRKRKAKKARQQYYDYETFHYTAIARCNGLRHDRRLVR